MNSRSVEIEGERIRLLADRAVYMERTKSLIISDIHLGKAATFRRFGIPIPHGTTEEDLARLDRLIESTNATRLLVLGDLLHSVHGKAVKTLQAVERWRAHHSSVEMLLIPGNHDRAAGEIPTAWKIKRVCETFLEGPFLFSHDDCESESFVIHGHLHPKVAIGVVAGARKSFPCFILSPRKLVLPAFGSFTGGHPYRLGAGERGFASIDGNLFPLQREPTAPED